MSKINSKLFEGVTDLYQAFQLGVTPESTAAPVSGGHADRPGALSD
jgi:hypothetical protein